MIVCFYLTILFYDIVKLSRIVPKKVSNQVEQSTIQKNITFLITDLVTLTDYTKVHDWFGTSIE